MERNRSLILLLLFSLLFTTKTQAQDDEPSQLYLAGGLTFSHISTEAFFDINLNTVPGANRRLSLEEDLNLSPNPQLLYMKAILGSRFSIGLSYLHVPRTADGNLQTNITIGDSVYTIGSMMHAYFNTDYYSASLRYSIIQNPIVTAGLSLGGRYMMIQSGFTATSYGNEFTRSEKINVPLILPGIYGSVWLPPGFIVRGSLEYLRAKVSNTTASALEASAAVEFYPIRFIGVGAGFSVMDIRADDIPENEIYLEDIRYTIRGFSVYAVLRF
jgi:hypothetical protein